MKRVLALGAVVILAALAVAGCGEQPRTAAGFCKVYYQQKQQYLSSYGNSPPNQPLRDLANLIGAMSDWVPIFEKLGQAAPPSIEPDVSNIVDALKQEQQAAGQEFSNPLGALGQGLEAALMSTASWDHVDAYIQKYCIEGGLGR